jgi:hypothetical protein
MNEEDNRRHCLKILSFCYGSSVPLVHYYLGKFLSPWVQSLKKKQLAIYMINCHFLATLGWIRGQSAIPFAYICVLKDLKYSSVSRAVLIVGIIVEEHLPQ